MGISSSPGLGGQSVPTNRASAASGLSRRLNTSRRDSAPRPRVVRVAARRVMSSTASFSARSPATITRCPGHEPARPSRPSPRADALKQASFGFVAGDTSRLRPRSSRPRALPWGSQSIRDDIIPAPLGPTVAQSHRQLTVVVFPIPPPLTRQTAIVTSYLPPFTQGYSTL